MRNHKSSKREVGAEATIYKAANILLDQSHLVTCALHFYHVHAKFICHAFP